MPTRQAISAKICAGVRVLALIGIADLRSILALFFLSGFENGGAKVGHGSGGMSLLRAAE